MNGNDRRMYVSSLKVKSMEVSEENVLNILNRFT